MNKCCKGTHGQSLAARVPQIQTDLVPLGLGSVHQQDTQRVGLGADVSVQEVVTRHGQLHLCNTLCSHV